ncbi:hypothetical protein pEaSNUABM37_00087 [Erwinia phage pEa_SNUABM_37]|nr:hypothetical protein pEaSNUABM37_00087 [Erwinia phage pEa_SNUABM_37]QXO10557.1 hypothetical protein pEaSNUABM48_00087 [Erwinia phage pEa_SNUABM_48]
MKSISELVAELNKKDDAINCTAADLKNKLITDMKSDVIAIVDEIINGKLLPNDFGEYRRKGTKARVTVKGLCVETDYNTYYERYVRILGQDTGVYEHFRDLSAIGRVVAKEVTNEGSHFCGFEGKQCIMTSTFFVFLVNDR